MQDPLERLQPLVDFGPYEPTPDAPGWHRGLAKLAFYDPGALALIGPAGVSVVLDNGDRVRSRLDPACVYLAALASRLRGTGQRLAVGVPPVSRHLPLILASAVVLANTLDRHRRVDRGQGVLVISPDLDVRSRYCDLFVGTVPLDAAHPGSRIRPTGERIMLSSGNHDGKDHGVCFFLPGRKLPDGIAFHPASCVVDLRYGRWVKRASDLATWIAKVCSQAGILVLYTIGDDDTLGALTRASFTDLPFDHTAVATCTERVRKKVAAQEGVSVDWMTADAPKFLSRDHVVRTIQNSEVADGLFRDIGNLLDQQKNQDNPDLNRARWILAALTHTPVPLIWYEEAARNLGRSTIRRLIAHLGARSRLDFGLGATLQTLRMFLQQLYAELEIANPRAEALRLLLPEIAAEAPKDQLLVLVRDKTMQRALQNWVGVEAFPQADWPKRIDIRACPDYADIASRAYGVAVVDGAFPRRYRWIGGSRLGSRVVFLTYPHEIEVVERQLNIFYAEDWNAGRARKREQTTSIVAGSDLDDARGAESQLPRLSLTMPTLPPAKAASGKPQPQAASFKSFEELASALRAEFLPAPRSAETERIMGEFTWQEDSGDEEASTEDLLAVGSEPHIDDVFCFRVEVNSRAHGTGILLLGTGQIVEFVRPSDPDDVQRRTPDMLEPGDVLLRMDETGRTSLFERFVELAEGQSSMRYLATWRRNWQDAVHKMESRYRIAHGTDYGRMFSDLKKAGATVESELAVRFWVEDVVIGPSTVESIRAVGQVSGSDALINHAQEFDRAFRRIRGIRQGIGRRLSGAIRKSFKHLAMKMPEHKGEHLDDRLGLPLDELVESIDMAEVLSIDKKAVKVPTHWVGRFRPTDQ